MTDRLYPASLDDIVRYATENQQLSAGVAEQLQAALGFVQPFVKELITAGKTLYTYEQQLEADIAAVTVSENEAGAALNSHPSRDSNQPESVGAVVCEFLGLAVVQLEAARSDFALLQHEQLLGMASSFRARANKLKNKRNMIQSALAGAQNQSSHWGEVVGATKELIEKRSQETITVRGVNQSIDTTQKQLKPESPTTSGTETEAVTPDAIAAGVEQTAQKLAGFEKRLTAFVQSLGALSTICATAEEPLTHWPGPMPIPPTVTAAHEGLLGALQQVAPGIDGAVLNERVAAIRLCKTAIEAVKRPLAIADDKKTEAHGLLAASKTKLETYVMRGN